MLKLPINTKINKHLPKKAFYAKFKLKTAAKDKFDADVSKISIINEVSPVTSTIAKGQNIANFFVLLISLKRKAFDEKNITLLATLIDQRMLFVLEYGAMAKLVVYHSRLLQTDWMPSTDLSVQLVGLSFDSVWENIIIQVGAVQIEPGNTLEKQLDIDKQRQQRSKQIAALERQARAEKQPWRKFQLVQEIKEIRSQLEE